MPSFHCAIKIIENVLYLFSLEWKRGGCGREKENENAKQLAECHCREASKSDDMSSIPRNPEKGWEKEVTSQNCPLTVCPRSWI